MLDGPAFLRYPRTRERLRPVHERVCDFNEVSIPLSEVELVEQASRCMDCGVPFCHGDGCPVANRIPELNSLVRRRRWRDACSILHRTNSFPEITGRVCPALCEAACTLAVSDEAVSIRSIELHTAERGFAEGWIKPQPPVKLTGRRVAIVGSGPAGLAAGQQLARAGHQVVVFEKSERPGGLLRYGIPDFKLDKRVLDRRLRQLEAEGVQFQGGVTVGEDISPRYLRKMFDATLLATGASQPRDLLIPGRGYENVHFALDYLSMQNRIVAGEVSVSESVISARDKVVVVVGGGDTGSDCVGTAVRQGAKEVHLVEILPVPPKKRNPATPWPQWPHILRTTSSHDEGCKRRWSVMVKRFSGTGIAVERLYGCKVAWKSTPQGPVMEELPGTELEMRVDLVLLAMGYLHTDHRGLVKALDLDLDQRGNLNVDSSFMTSEPGLFATGDAVSGATLIVHAIRAGRLAARAIDCWLRR